MCVFSRVRLVFHREGNSGRRSRHAVIYCLRTLTVACELSVVITCISGSRSAAWVTLKFEEPGDLARKTSVKTIPLPEIPGVEGDREALI